MATSLVQRREEYVQIIQGQIIQETMWMRPYPGRVALVNECRVALVNEGRVR